jgi:hypothetical protein
MDRSIIGLCIVLAVFWYIGSTTQFPSTTKLPPPDHANTVIAAAQLNEQWEKTFDKTGKYPERQDPSIHQSVYGTLIRIPQDSDSYSAARPLIDKSAARQMKIDAQEPQGKDGPHHQ